MGPGLWKAGQGQACWDPVDREEAPELTEVRHQHVLLGVSSGPRPNQRMLRFLIQEMGNIEA